MIMMIRAMMTMMLTSSWLVDIEKGIKFAVLSNLFKSWCLGAVHILRQPPEGGEGVRQMLTIADEGGRGGQPKADHC